MIYSLFQIFVFDPDLIVESCREVVPDLEFNF